MTQTELASLARVDRGSVLSWEKGKFKPKAEKAAQLASLATKGKEEVRKLLGEKKAEQETKPKRPKMRGIEPGKKATEPCLEYPQNRIPLQFSLKNGIPTIYLTGFAGLI